MNNVYQGFNIGHRVALTTEFIAKYSQITGCKPDEAGHTGTIAYLCTLPEGPYAGIAWDHRPLELYVARLNNIDLVYER